MASSTLYPCIVNSYEPAFVVDVNHKDDSLCRINFNLSRFSSYDKITGIHIAIYDQDTGVNVVNREDNTVKNRYRSAGTIILNKDDIIAINEKDDVEVPVDMNGNEFHYYVNILNEDIRGGWQPGTVYKVQLRLVETITYNPSSANTAYQWLTNNMYYFSEWSTVCLVKAIPPINIKIPILAFDTTETQVNKQVALRLTSLNLNGKMFCEDDQSEYLESYRYTLYEEATYSSDANPIEDSGWVFTDQYYHNNEMPYIFHTNLKDAEAYILFVEIETANKYKKSWEINMLINNSGIDSTKWGITGLGNKVTDHLEKHRSLTDELRKKICEQEESEQGRIGLQFTNRETASGINLCILRSSSRTGFSKWEDFKIIPFVNETPVSEKYIFYDYTIESGVYYKYAVQGITGSLERNQICENTDRYLTTRVFEDSFLVGEGGQQLKLCFNNDMPSFRRQVSDSKIETLNNKYPFISRNGHMDYKVFPMNGLITLAMDDFELFCSKESLYKVKSEGQDVSSTYYNKDVHTDYDFTQEREFRDKVLDFLYDGKPKLFKSPTEGNVLVRLTDVSCTPIQSIGRLVYSFTATANEIGEASLENCIKYGIHTVGKPSTEFKESNVHLGQVVLDIKPDGDTTNILGEIKEKYDRSEQSILGMRYSLGKIYGLRLQFEGNSLKYKNNAEEVYLGNQIQVKHGDSESIISIYDIFGDHRAGENSGYVNRVYQFADEIEFNGNGTDSIIIPPCLDCKDDGWKTSQHEPIKVIVDFIYQLIEEKYVEKEIRERITNSIVGQYYFTSKDSYDIYNMIKYKYYYDWPEYFSYLDSLRRVRIHAPTGTKFKIQYENNNVLDVKVGYSQELNLIDLGKIVKLDFVGSELPTSIMIDYEATVITGKYKVGG